jgi:hypothetical protein
VVIGKALASKERGGLGRLLSRLRREDEPPAPWWKRLPQQVADRTNSRSAASTRWPAALAALGATTAAVVVLARRRRHAEEGPPDLSVQAGDPAAEEASGTFT